MGINGIINVLKRITDETKWALFLRRIQRDPIILKTLNENINKTDLQILSQDVATSESGDQMPDGMRLLFPRSRIFHRVLLIHAIMDTVLPFSHDIASIVSDFIHLDDLHPDRLYALELNDGLLFACNNSSACLHTPEEIGIQIANVMADHKEKVAKYEADIHAATAGSPNMDQARNYPPYLPTWELERLNLELRVMQRMSVIHPPSSAAWKALSRCRQEHKGIVQVPHYIRFCLGEWPSLPLFAHHFRNFGTKLTYSYNPQELLTRIQTLLALYFPNQCSRIWYDCEEEPCPEMSPDTPETDVHHFYERLRRGEDPAIPDECCNPNCPHNTKSVASAAPGPSKRQINLITQYFSSSTSTKLKRKVTESDAERLIVGESPTKKPKAAVSTANTAEAHSADSHHCSSFDLSSPTTRSLLVCTRCCLTAYCCNECRLADNSNHQLLCEPL